MRRLVLISLSLAVLVAGAYVGSSRSSTLTMARAVRIAACKQVAKPAPRSSGSLKAPTSTLDPSKRWTLTFHTSCGTFVVLLQPKTSPHATASLVALARKRFFDNTIIHRVVPGFVIQGGDPTQTGGGGPGYTTVDTPGAGTRYRRGVVAMAKTQTEPRGTAGSQFFVMTADAPTLPADYAVVGRVVSGMPVVTRIGKLGDPSDPNGTPTKTVTVSRVVVGKH